jgi:hypothetical protein
LIYEFYFGSSNFSYYLQPGATKETSRQFEVSEYLKEYYPLPDQDPSPVCEHATDGNMIGTNTYNKKLHITIGTVPKTQSKNQYP